MATIANLDVKIGAKTQDFKKGINGVQNSLKKLAGIIGVAFGARQIIRFTGEAIKLSGVAEGVAAAFERIATPGLLDDLVRATKGTVSQLELMQQAVMASNFRIPLDVFAKGLEFATRRAKEMGLAVDFMVNSFTVGMGRESVKILDNLGLSIKEIAEEEKKVGNFALAVGNIIEREMTEAGEAVDTVADKAARMNAQLDDTKVLFGQITTESLGLKDGIDGINESLSTMNEILASETFQTGIKKGADAWKFYAKALFTTNPIFQVMKGNFKASMLLLDRLDKRLAGGLPGRAGLGLGTAIPTPPEVILPETLTTLRTDLENINSLIDTTDIADIADIIELQNIALAIEQQIEAIEGLALAQAKAFNPPLETMEKLPAVLLDVSEAVADVDDSLKENAETWANFTAPTWKDMVEQSQVLSEAMVDAFTGIGEGIGDLITSTGGIEGFFLGLLNIIADFAKSMGKVLAAIGTAFLFIPGAQGLGVGLIGAGIGLTALGQVGSNLISRQNINVTGTTRTEGRDLVTVFERGQDFKGAVT